MRIPTLFFLIFLAPSVQAAGVAMNELALFHRCYSQLTNTRAKANASLTKQVETGQLSAVDACLLVFNSAKLNGSGSMTLNSSDAQAVSVLATFHRLHSSWFWSKDFPIISWPGHAGDMKDIYDSSSPALYFTRALLGANVRADDAVTTNDFLQAVRTNPSPNVGPESGHPATDFIFTTKFSFAATGTLLGVQHTPNVAVSFPTTGANPSVDLYRNYGGGFLGTQSYISLNLAPLSSYETYRTDGALKMHRRYGKAFYKDVLCRELPVVRESDATAYVVSESPIAFRTSAACTKCHVSHDRVSSVIRGIHVRYLGTGDPTGIGSKQRGGNFALFHPVTKAAESAWPSSPDRDYSVRPPNGTLYFRSFQGTLVDEPVTSVEDLGRKVAATDDYYLCLARRYYRYFLGIDVNTGDINDPDRKLALSAPDLAHRNAVIKLGTDLKKSQSLPQLIKSILSLDTYRKTDFGARSAQ